MTMRRSGRLLVTGLGAEDPLRLLLRNPALVIATDPCDAHRAAFDLRLAALKCLGHGEFLQLGCSQRWPRLYPRFRWLVSDRSLLAWDGCVESLASRYSPGAVEFALMKERATRIELLARPLDIVLAGLPRGVADGVFAAYACGADPSRVLAETRRVVRKAFLEDEPPVQRPARLPAAVAT